MDEYPYLFTMDALWLFDRNFPGAPRVARLIKKTHVLIRVKSDIPLKRVAFLLDRSWLADLAGGEGKERVTGRVRVIEYWVTVEGQDVPEMFCLITDLLDCEAYPARVLAAAYRWRWDGSETGLRETKSLLDGPAPPPGRCSAPGPRCWSGRSSPPGHWPANWSAAWSATPPTPAAPARKGRRAGQPVHPRQLSFTAARRAAITSIRQGTAAAGLPAAAVAAGTARLLAAVGRARHVTDRNRHRPRNTKARQAFEKAHRNTPTWIAEAVLDICGQAA